MQEPAWEKISDDDKYRTRYEGVMPDGGKVGRVISTIGDDYRESYYVPQNLRDSVKEIGSDSLALEDYAREVRITKLSDGKKTAIENLEKKSSQFFNKHQLLPDVVKNVLADSARKRLGVKSRSIQQRLETENKSAWLRFVATNQGGDNLRSFAREIEKKVKQEHEAKWNEGSKSKIDIPDEIHKAARSEFDKHPLLGVSSAFEDAIKEHSKKKKRKSLPQTKHQQLISEKIKSDESLRFSGRTFQNKNVIKAMGARWNPRDKEWEIQATDLEMVFSKTLEELAEKGVDLYQSRHDFIAEHYSKYHDAPPS